MSASLFGLKVSQRSPDRKFPYGYYRVETLVSLIVSVLIIIVGVELLRESIIQVLEPIQLRFAFLAFAAAVGSAIVSSMIFYYLKKTGTRIGSEILLINARERKSDIIKSSLVFVSLMFSYIGFLHAGGIVGIIFFNADYKKSKKGYIEIDDNKIYYEVSGFRKPIVLLHDGLFSSSVWDNQFKLLSKKYKVIRYDRRGFGNSSPANSPYYEHEDLLELLNYLKIRKVNIIGTSGGGSIAIDFALSYPNKVIKMVLVGAIFSGYEFNKSYHDRNMSNLEPFFTNSNIEKTAENWINDPYLLPSFNTEDEILDYIKDEFKHLPSLFESYPNINQLDPPAIERLSELNMPVLIIVGELDLPDVLNIADIMNTHIKNSEKIVFTGAGHILNLEKPDEFNETIVNFLK